LKYDPFAANKRETDRDDPGDHFRRFNRHAKGFRKQSEANDINERRRAADR